MKHNPITSDELFVDHLHNLDGIVLDAQQLREVFPFHRFVHVIANVIVVKIILDHLEPVFRQPLNLELLIFEHLYGFAYRMRLEHFLCGHTKQLFFEWQPKELLSQIDILRFEPQLPGNFQARLKPFLGQFQILLIGLLPLSPIPEQLDLPPRPHLGILLENIKLMDEVMHILDPHIHPEATGGRDGVGCVAGQEDIPLAEAGGDLGTQ